MFKTEVVKWLVNPLSPSPSPRPFDMGELISFLQSHRLVGQFLHRVRSESPRWCNSELVARVTGLHWQAKQHADKVIRAIHEIQDEVLDGSDPVIVLKGISAYALLSDERFLWYFSDLDLLPSDPILFGTMLDRLGYDVLPCPANDNEYAIGIRDGLPVELHKYIRILSYPEGLIESQCTRKTEGRCLQPSFYRRLNGMNSDEYARLIESQGFDRELLRKTFTTGELSYSDVSPHTTFGRTPGTDRILIADYEMLALTLCIDNHKDYITAMDHRPIPIQLGTLMAVLELSSRPEYSFSKFRDLASYHHAQDAVRLIALLLHEYFGSDVMLDAIGRRSDTIGTFPRQVFCGGPWMTLPSAEALLTGLGQEDVNEWMGTNAILATSEGEDRRTYSFDKCGEISSASRMFVRSGRDDPARIAVAIKATSDLLQFIVSFFDALLSDADYEVVLIHSDTGKQHYVGVLERRTIVDARNICSLYFMAKDNDLHLCISIPRNQDEEANTARGLPFYLKIGKRHVENNPTFEDIDPEITIPITVILPDSF